ncbi:MAG: hypothetical protein ACREOO_32725 [bacterium]
MSREIADTLVDCDVVCLTWIRRVGALNWVKHEWLITRALEWPIIVCLLPDAPKLPELSFNLYGVIFDELKKAASN